MRFWNIIAAMIIAFSLVTGCGSKEKVMTVEDYAKIESEIEIPDPELDPGRVEKVASKYGFTYAQYKEFYNKVQKDPQLREKLGDYMLKKQKSAGK